MRRVPLLALVFSLAAFAAPLPFHAHFESGSVVTGFDNSSFPVAANSITSSTAAAHDGARGMRLVDADSSSGDQAQNEVSIGLPGGANTLFVRSWMRVSNPNGSGSLHVLRIVAAGNSPLVSVNLYFQSNTFALAHRHPTLGYELGPSGAVWTEGRWMLVEAYGEGAKADGGIARLFVDGVERKRVPLAPWDGGSGIATEVVAGGGWSSGSSTSTVDFDDLRVARTPLPSNAAIELPAGPFATGTCTPFMLRAMASTGDAVTSVPYEVPLSFELDGGAALFSDPACQVTAASARFGPDAGTALLHVRAATPGTVSLAVRSPDLLASAATLTFEGPVAKLQPEALTIEQGQVASLSAAQSSVPASAAPAKYLWSLPRGPTGLSFAEGAEQTFTLFAPGTYEVELVVEDAKGHKSQPTRAVIEVTGDDGLTSGPLHGCSASGSLGVAGLLLVAVMLSRRAARAS